MEATYDNTKLCKKKNQDDFFSELTWLKIIFFFVCVSEANANKKNIIDLL